VKHRKSAKIRLAVNVLNVHAGGKSLKRESWSYFHI